MKFALHPQGCTSGNSLLFRLMKLLQLTKMWKLMKLHNVLRSASEDPAAIRPSFGEI